MTDTTAPLMLADRIKPLADVTPLATHFTTTATATPLASPPTTNSSHAQPGGQPDVGGVGQTASWAVAMLFDIAHRI